MKLFDAVWAPSPRRVRIYLQEKGLSVDRVSVDMRAGEHLKAPYMGVNPRQQVPALLLEDGTVIDDSVAICRYLESLYPDPPLFGRDPREIGVIEAWIRRIESDCHGAVVDAFRNSSRGFVDRALPGEWPPLPQIAALAERGRCMWAAFADIFDRRLADNTYVAGEHYSFADIMAMVAIDFGIAVHLPDPRDRPSLARWHAAMSARPSATA